MVRRVQLGTLKLADHNWKLTQTRRFYGHSYSAPTDSQSLKHSLFIFENLHSNQAPQCPSKRLGHGPNRPKGSIATGIRIILILRSRRSPMTVSPVVLVPVILSVLFSRPIFFFSYFCRCKSALAVNRNTTMGSGGNKKLPPRRFSTVGIVREFRRSPTQPSPQTSSTWWCRLPLLWRVNYGYAQ